MAHQRRTTFLALDAASGLADCWHDHPQSQTSLLSPPRSACPYQDQADQGRPASLQYPDAECKSSNSKAPPEMLTSVRVN